MAEEPTNLPEESIEPQPDAPTVTDTNTNDKPPVEDLPSDSPPHPPRRRDKDSRERRDERDFDRPPNRRGGGGDYYDRNRSPLPPPPRERERDFKRRLSPSPPPPYRDRRPYSPSRRSPPPFKRPRREDGGPDGRRGFGNDRRFGYEHQGGYDRDMGGRSGYPDERPGRYFGRPNGGFQGGRADWDSNRPGYNDGLNTGNAQREGLMSYKQFMQELEDDILPSEAERRYQEYKTEYITTQKRTYFEAHKDEEWLRNKYHPTNLLSVIDRRNDRARGVAKDFLTFLHSSELNLGPSALLNKSEQTSGLNSEDEADGAKRKQQGRKETDQRAAPKAHPVSAEPRRIRLDVDIALALVRKLDSEKGINDNTLARPDNEKINKDKSHGSTGPVIIIRGITSVKGLEGVELLDTLVTYLWRIHGLDYYGMIEAIEPKGLRHVRFEGKNPDAAKTADDWESKLDLHWQERLKSLDPLEIMTAKEKIDAAAAEALDPYVRKIRDEKYGWKYGCGAKGCTKLFHAPEFVQKHLKLKHPEVSMERTSKVCEDLYYQNYMNDQDAPGGQPIMQHTMKREKFPRRRDPHDNRLNDDRDRRRGNGPDTDFQSNNDDPEKGNDDEPMYDNFNGQHMRVPPFGSDMPPQVLMPVPGAGPLGPFVPAPPDVAMRMLREQGGPPSLDAGGRSAHPGMGGAPIILPPNFREDPRRLRSYQDLDAPEDEVTVIDYRSL